MECAESGKWTEKGQAWYDVQVTNCDVCGRLLSQELWQFDDGVFGTFRSCGPGCEALWYGYLRRRRLEIADQETLAAGG